MNPDKNTQEKLKKNLLYRFDQLLKPIIPNFNLRAIVYLSLIFGTAMYIQIWRISSSHEDVKPSEEQKETVIADEGYWDSNKYKERMQKQTVESFTQELQNWLANKDQEFTRRKFEDILFINGGSSPMTGSDASIVVLENFNYLENHARARYQYTKDNNFLADLPTLVKLGKVMCDIDEKTEQVTNIELYDWRYADMKKLAEFMKTKPDWKAQVGDRILDVSDPSIEDKEVLKLRNVQTQPAGLFSFLIFHNTENNRIVLADSTILDKNGVDTELTLSRISAKWNKEPKIYFEFGNEGCRQLDKVPELDYGHTD